MTNKNVFVDTNILVYAYDIDAREKYQIANKIIENFWSNPMLPFISIQVLQEFYVNLVKKGIKLAEAKSVVLDYLKWNIIRNDESIFISAIEIMQNYALSFWDSSIISAAIKANVTEVLSEDMNHGQFYYGVKIVNPFK